MLNNKKIDNLVNVIRHSAVYPDKVGIALAHINQLPQNLQIAYVRLMMQVIADSLVAISQIDATVQQEISGYPTGLTIRMEVLPKIASFTLQVTDNHQFRKVDCNDVDLALKFKHLNLALLVFSFQESTSQSYANDRLVADGDVGYSVRFVRLLNRLEVIILPKLIASRAVKRYPTDVSVASKVSLATKVYAKTVQTMLKAAIS